LSAYSIEPPIGGKGWGIRRVGPCVLGFWTEPMTEERVRECRRLYRAAQRAHGSFSVFSVFTSTPFRLESLLASQTRDLIVEMLNEFGEHLSALTCVFEMPRGFQTSIARTSAAAVTRLTRTRIPFVFADTREEGFALARARGALDLVDEATHRVHLEELSRIAAGEPRPSLRASGA
jgi:hypothetical protein